MREPSYAQRRSATWSSALLCAALWAVIILYAWNHRVFVPDAAKLF